MIHEHCNSNINMIVMVTEITIVTITEITIAIMSSLVVSFSTTYDVNTLGSSVGSTLTTYGVHKEVSVKSDKTEMLTILLISIIPRIPISY